MTRSGRSVLMVLVLAAVVPFGLGCPPARSGIDFDSLSPCQQDIVERTRVNSQEELLFILETTRCS